MPLVLIVVGLLAGCAYGVEPAPPEPRPYGPENPSGNPTPETWLAQVCSALGPAVRPAPAPAIRTDDLPGSRERMMAYLDERIASFDAAADGINQAGPAPVEAGQSVTEPVVRLLRERSATMAMLREDLRAVPEVAEGTLLNTLQEVRGRLVLAGAPISLPDLALPPGLAAQAAAVPSCRAPAAGPG
ncbi:MAG TPA: hypothetical protein VK935_22415 [Actinomycetospora sp.]|nr:hypothetical protein [Actinomycetospora sp.]